MSPVASCAVIAAPRSRYGKAQGFTLLEVLIVLVIVAVMAGLLVFSFNDSPPTKLRREASDLASLINAASDEAVMRGVELGLAVNEAGYQFVYFDPEKKQWQGARERGLAPHKFPETYSIDFAIDGAAVDAVTRQRIQALAERAEDTALRPILLILSSGEVTPFRLGLTVGKEAPITLVGDGLNPVIAMTEAELAAAQSGAPSGEAGPGSSNEREGAAGGESE